MLTTTTDLQVFTVTSTELALVTVCGEIDVATAARLRCELDDAINDGASRVVIDLSDATFTDSAGLNVLVSTTTRLRRAGGELVVRRPSPMLQRALVITHLDRALTVEQ